MRNEQFLHGVVAMKRGGWSDAHKQFDLACRSEPHNPRLEAHRAWAKYMLLRHRDARVSDNNQGDVWLGGVAKKNCRGIIRAATEKVRDFTDGYVFLGRILLDEGNSAEAVVVLKKAVRIDCDNLEAQRYLREAQLRAPSTSNQIAKRISDWFGKIGGAPEKKSDRIRPIKMHNVRRPHL